MTCIFLIVFNFNLFNRKNLTIFLFIVLISWMSIIYISCLFFNTFICKTFSFQVFLDVSLAGRAAHSLEMPQQYHLVEELFRELSSGWAAAVHFCSGEEHAFLMPAAVFNQKVFGAICTESCRPRKFLVSYGSYQDGCPRHLQSRSLKLQLPVFDLHCFFFHKRMQLDTLFILGQVLACAAIDRHKRQAARKGKETQGGSVCALCHTSPT